jgi:uncharacterized membrane protein
MAETIAGFFNTQAAGQHARTTLLQAGFLKNQVSFLAGDTRGHQTPDIGPVLKESESEAGDDAFKGAAIGLLAGTVALFLPGIGPVLAAGPLAAWIGGMTAGAAAGGITGLLKDHGISDEDAQFYAQGVARGGALVTVHDVSPEREKIARKILDESGAIGTEQLAADLAKPATAHPKAGGSSSADK